jgi:D-lactate dehydrogenase (cytochrome)
MGLPIARLEFIDEVCAEAFNNYAGLSLPHCPHLMVEFHGDTDGVNDAQAAFSQIAQDFNATQYQHANRSEDRTALWKMRQHALYAVKSLQPTALAMITDVCVPISKLDQAMKEAQALIKASDLMGPIFGHVGDGHFHAVLLFENDNVKQLNMAQKLSDNIGKIAISLGGTISGENGIGAGKLHLMEAQHGDAWGLMGDIKSTLDPKGILNPGKVTPPQTPLLIH